MAVISAGLTVVMTWISLEEAGFGRVLSVAAAVLGVACATMFIAAYVKAVKAGL